MYVNNEISEKEQAKVQYAQETSYSYVLVLHNDDYNTFDFVIEVLMRECKHDELQAEQCALITHYKGKCDVMLGELDSLKEVKSKIETAGLNVTLEKI